jgi:hypothetical protein
MTKPQRNTTDKTSVGVMAIGLLGGCPGLNTFGPPSHDSGESSETSSSGGPEPTTTTTSTSDGASTGEGMTLLDTTAQTSSETGGTTGEPPPSCAATGWSPYVVPFVGEEDPTASYLLSGLEIDEDGHYTLGGTLYKGVDSSDVIVMKRDIEADTVEWARDFCSSYVSGVEDMVMTELGDVYIAGHFYNAMDPCCGQESCPEGLGGWSSLTYSDSFAVKLDGKSGDAVWGAKHDAGGIDGALGIAVNDIGEVSMVGFCEDGAGVLTAHLDGAGVQSARCFASPSTRASGWATEWLADGIAVAGAFEDLLAIGVPEPEAHGDLDGFFAVLTPSQLTTHSSEGLGGAGADYVQSMTKLANGRVALAGSCSDDWILGDEECGIDRSPFVLTMTPDGQQVQGRVLRGDRLGQILDIHATADGAYIVVGGVISGTDIDADIGRYVLGKGYAALLRADTLEKVQEWTLEGALSQVRAVDVDAEGRLVFGGTYNKPRVEGEILWRGKRFGEDPGMVPDTVMPPGDRDYSMFVIRECMPG